MLESQSILVGKRCFNDYTFQKKLSKRSFCDFPASGLALMANYPLFLLEERLRGPGRDINFGVPSSIEFFSSVRWQLAPASHAVRDPT